MLRRNQISKFAKNGLANPSPRGAPPPPTVHKRCTQKVHPEVHPEGHPEGHIAKNDQNWQKITKLAKMAN